MLNQHWWRSPSSPGQHLAFQEAVSRAPVHLALDHFEAVDLPLNRVVTGLSLCVVHRAVEMQIEPHACIFGGRTF
jgi:hypothetical protein